MLFYLRQGREPGHLPRKLQMELVDNANTIMKPVTMVAGLALTAFAIDRTVTAIVFLLSYVWKQLDPSSIDGPEHHEAERTYKLVYVSLASILALTAYHFVFHIGSVFAALDFQPNATLDAVVTTLVLVGGSERVAALLKVPGGEKAPAPPPPVQVAGSVMLVSDSANTEHKTAGMA